MLQPSQKSLLDLVNSTEAFPIDFENAWKEVGFSSKIKARQMLYKHFDLGKDYLDVRQDLTRSQSKKHNKNPQIKLNIECYKNFALLAGSLEGKQIRSNIIRCQSIAQKQPKIKIIELSSNFKLETSVALSKILEYLSEPLTNINLAIEMLNKTSDRTKYSIYFSILCSECFRIGDFFEQLSKLQELTEPKNLQLLQQFHCVESKEDLMYHSNLFYSKVTKVFEILFKNICKNIKYLYLIVRLAGECKQIEESGVVKSLTFSSAINLLVKREISQEISNGSRVLTKMLNNTDINI